MEPDVRDQVVDFVDKWSVRAEMPASALLGKLELPRGKFYEWKKRYGLANEHNGKLCRDFWLLEEEKRAIASYAASHPLEGYRRLTYMMMDENVACASPASVYRVLKAAGMLKGWAGPKTQSKGSGFIQPTRPHEHWHIDVSYINIAGTFYYLCSVLDGYSRAIVHWDLCEAMKERDVEMVLQKAYEAAGKPAPRIISDNGPQFISRDFKEFVRVLGMTHVRTSPYYPQSNGKLERFHGTAKSEAVRPGLPMSLEDARRILTGYIAHYNETRLHSAIGYVTPKAMLEGRRQEIHDRRDRQLETARLARAKAHAQSTLTLPQSASTQENQSEKQTRALEESNPPGISEGSEQPGKSAKTTDFPTPISTGLGLLHA